MFSPLTPRFLFGRTSSEETQRLNDLLRKETVGGVLLLIATAAAMAWANSPWASAYHQLGDITVGPTALHLDLSLSEWAADGLLAIFFFMVGLELKHEFLAGDLRDPRRAALPVMAAIGGMIAPAAVFVAVNLNTGDSALNGWAIPTATDIAFALAVLAVISSHLPTALRTFLLTLAVVDDLLAVTVIAIFYTDDLNLAALGLALVPLLAFGFAARRLRTPWGAATAGGAHLASRSRIRRSRHHRRRAPRTRRARCAPDKADSPRKGLQAKDLEHRLRPISAGLAVPIFAFFAAGVTIGGLDGFLNTLRDPVALGIIAGLVLGKAIGITGAAALTATLTRAELDKSLTWIDVLGVALLGGIGFTVSLLIGDLAYADNPTREEHVKLGVLTGTITAAILASTLLSTRNRAYRRSASATD